MSAFECSREQDVLDEVDGGRWPDRTPEDLRAHIATCEVCRDLADVVSLMREDSEAARQSAVVPSAGQVWWRAELRARNEAARTAQRPMTFVQALAAVCTLVALLALASLAAPAVGAWAGRVAEAVAAPRMDLGAVTGFVGHWGRVLALALGVWLVLAPVAVYLMLRDDRAED